MGTSPVRHSAINRELRPVAELSHSSYRVKTRILLAASQPFWTRLRSTLARRLAIEGPFGQSRTICNVTPPIFAASVRVALAEIHIRYHVQTV
jgi:hypothetical protein